MKLSSFNLKLSLLVAISLLLLVFTLPTVGISAEKSTLDKILSSGTFTISSHGGIPRLSFKDPKTGKQTGFFIELARGYADSIGVELKVKAYDWSGVIPSLQSGKADMIVAELTRSVPRSTRMYFTNPTMENNIKMLVRKGSGLDTLEDINQEGIRITENEGSIWVKRAKEKFPKAKVVTVPGTADNAAALASKRADAYMNSRIDLQNAMEQYPGQFKVIGPVIFTNIYCAAVRFESEKLLRSFNTYLRHIKLNGRFNELYKKWIGREWEPNPKSTSGI